MGLKICDKLNYLSQYNSINTSEMQFCRFLSWWLWRFWTWCHIIWYVHANIPEKCCLYLSGTSECLYLVMKLHNVTLQKTVTFKWD